MATPFGRKRFVKEASLRSLDAWVRSRKTNVGQTLDKRWTNVGPVFGWRSVSRPLSLSFAVCRPRTDELKVAHR